jgi:Fe-S-cluster containining protein
MKPQHALQHYVELRDEISRQADMLFAVYRDRVQCGFGCYYCCEDISVPAIEVEVIRRHLQAAGYPRPEHLGGPVNDRGKTPEGRSVGRCAFLGSRGECTIYPARPLICRSHGLPLAYRVYEYNAHGREIHGESPEYMDLWCDLNFREFAHDRGGTEPLRFFDRHGRINMDSVNRRLEGLNRAFKAGPDGSRYSKMERVPLSILLTGG